MDAHKQSEPEAQPGEKLPSPPSPAMLPQHWGSGDKQVSRDTLRAVERAIRQRWPIPDAIRGKLPEEMARIVEDPQATARDKVAAGRVLAHLDSLNLDQEKRDTGEDNVRAVVHISGEQVKSFANDLLAKRLALAGPVPVQAEPAGQCAGHPGEGDASQRSA